MMNTISAITLKACVKIIRLFAHGFFTNIRKAITTSDDKYADMAISIALTPLLGRNGVETRITHFVLKK